MVNFRKVYLAIPHTLVVQGKYRMYYYDLISCHELLRSYRKFYAKLDRDSTAERWVKFLIRKLEMPLETKKTRNYFYIGYEGKKPHFLWHLIRPGLIEKNYEYIERIIESDPEDLFQEMIKYSRRIIRCWPGSFFGISYSDEKVFFVPKSRKISWKAGLDCGSSLISDAFYHPTKRTVNLPKDYLI